MQASRIFLYLCLAFVGGVVLNSLIIVPHLFVWGFFVFGLSFIAIFWKKDKKVVVAGFCMLLFATGIFRHQMFEQPEDSLEYYKSGHASEPYSYDRGNMIENSIYRFKENLGESLDSSLSPPHSSIVGAMMLGEEERLSWELKQKLNISGTRHIIAISGMHVVILANILIGAGLIFGLWRGQAFYFAIATIVLFIIMVGAPPSAIRAGIMGGIVLFAEKVGRLSRAQRLLIIAATVMLAFNPLLLEFDVGFQLSFLATLGIAELGPYFRKILRWVPKQLEIRNTISMTIPAVVFTAPVLASNFEQFSVIALFTNILVLPVFSFILGLGLFAGIAGMIFPFFGQIAFWPVWLFASYAHAIIDWSARIPFAAVGVEVFPWYIAALYFALVWWGIKYFNLER